MAKIPLRSYLHDVEDMIDKGHTEEAAAHCRYILQSFPKLLAAYRLLGKAFLENRQYADAADLFQRVLSSTPDDFVSQVGMSIIREDEGNMDDAIWHMERAFEVQPYNVSLQDELRRLYGRRDGVEPPKIRLTRGALARMYAKGSLYQQAIAELRAGLMEESTRVDLQVVLAWMYFQNRQRVDAVDACSALLQKFPYCLQANRILALILPGTGRKEDAQTYLQRVQALDPYMVHAAPDALDSDAVSENIVMLDRLDYKTVAVPEGTAQPAWASSIGVNINESSSKNEEVPAWLASIQQKVASDSKKQENTLSTSPFVLDSAQPEKSVPEAGSRPGNMQSPGDPGRAEHIEQDSSSGQAGDASLPEWMKEAGWVQGSGSTSEGEQGSKNSPAAPMDDGIAKADMPDWLKAMAPEDVTNELTSQPLPADDQSRLTGSGEAKSTGDEGLPDWLNELGAADAAGMSLPPAEEPIAPPAAAPESQAPAQPADEIPDWLREMGEPQQAEPAPVPPAQKATIWEEEKPVEIPVSAPLEESVPGVNLNDQDASLAWLESLAAKQGASEEEFITKPEQRLETPPSWVQEIVPGEQKVGEPSNIEPPAAVEQVSPQEPIQEPTAAEVSAETPAEAGEAELPDWLKEMAGETTPASPISEAAATDQAAPPAELPDWLAAISAGAAAGAASVPQGQPEPAVDQTGPVEATVSPVETVESQLETIPTAVEAETVPSEVVEPEITAEPAVHEPKEEEAVPVSGVELPDWLQELARENAPTPPAAVSPAIEETGGEPLPDWLEAIGQPESPATAASEAPVESLEPAQASVEPAVQAAPEIEAQPPAEKTEEDAAMAWLESLAARQGAPEEELTTRPEERPAAPPAWVQAEAAEAQPPVELQAPVEEPAAAAQEPIALETTTSEGQPLVEELPGVEEQTPAAEHLEAASEEPQPAAEQALPDWLREMSAPEEAPAAQEAPVSEPIPAEAASIAPVSETVSAEAAPEALVPESQEAVPPLPAWLENATEEEAVEEPVPGAQKLNINNASLVELEKLPGVGFILAQAIINHRQQFGPFNRVDDLAAVDGFNPGIVAEISDKITTAAATETVAFGSKEPESVDDYSAELIKARNAMVAGELDSTLEHYGQLIKKDQFLDDVIQDLHEALFRYPVDANIWTTLGDAYMHNNQLQEALDSYVKAEELIR